MPSEGQGKPAQFIPVRFVFYNKLTKGDRLSLAFDALVLSEVLGCQVSVGKIIYGDDHAVLKVRIAGLLAEVRKLFGKLTMLLATGSPADLILNRHCAEFEFQARCRQKANETDDVSLLSGMEEGERTKHRSKGIFTVKQFFALEGGDSGGAIQERGTQMLPSSLSRASRSFVAGKYFADR